MASSSLCIFSSGVTFNATSSDSRLARWNRHKRSTAMVSDQIDIASSTTTTPFATKFIVDHIPSRLKLVGSMGLLLSTPSLLQAEIDREVVNHRDRLAVERSGAEAPALDRLECGAA